MTLAARFGRHAYVIGMTGVGKSYLLEHWVLQLLRERSGVAFFDTNGDTHDDLIARIAQMDRRIWDRVVIIDPSDLFYTVNLDPLQLEVGEAPQYRADFLATVLAKMFKADLDVTVRMHNIMRHTFQLLIECNLPLLEAQRVLADGKYREDLLRHFPPTHELVLFWKGELPQDWNRVREWIQSTTNKLNPFLSQPPIRAMFQRGEHPLQFRQLMDEGAFIFIKASKGILGQHTSSLLCAFLLAQFQLAAFSRANIHQEQRRQYTLICDEFADYATDDIATILSQGRKYGLGMVLAHQSLAQFIDAEKLRETVLENAELLISFRVGAQDAERLSRDIFTPRIDQIKDIRKRKVPTGIRYWPYFTEEEPVWRPLPEIWEHEENRLQLLPKRHYWRKHRGPYKATRFQTPELSSIQWNRQLLNRIATLKAVSYGRHGMQRDQLDISGTDAHDTTTGLVSDVETTEKE